MGWTRRTNRRGMINERSGCARGGGRKEKADTEVGGLREEIFGGIERAVESENERGVGDGSETGTVTEGKGKQIEDQYRCQPRPGLQGQRGEQQHQEPL